MNQSKESGWVNVYDDVLMVSLGIRLPIVTPRDKEVWTKTSYEKKQLKALRNNKKMYFHTIPQRSIPVYSKLIIYLKKNNIFGKTTYSINCWQHEIGNILSKYYQLNKKSGLNECLISYYKYNGKVYKPEERPFWF